MPVFYDDPYSWIDDACESIERMDQSRAQSEALIAIAIVLLGFVESQQDDSDVPAAPIIYEDFPNGD